jgi:hypothetical protein
MNKRFLVIKDKITLIIIKGWYFDLSRLEEVKSQAQERLEDFCEVNKLDSTNFFWEITK